MAGLDDVHDIFARLNGKQETEEEKLAKERRKAMRYVGQRMGTIPFMRGGLLVQEDLEGFVDEEVRTPRETAEAIEDYEMDMDMEGVDRKLKVVRKRKALLDSEAQTETDAVESDGRAERKRRRKEEKAEKKMRREEKRRGRKEGSSGAAESDTAQVTPKSPGEAPLASGDQREIVKEKGTAVVSNTDSASDQAPTLKKSKKDRKSRKSPARELLASPAVDPICDEPSSISLGDPESATPRRHENCITKASSKKSKMSKKGSRSAPTSQISTPIATGTSTPTGTGTSTPLGGRHIHHARRVAAKHAAVLDATALKEVRIFFTGLLMPTILF
jgi:Pin2-interacting protein X1